MARTNELVFALNAGGVDPDALARVDLEKMRLAGVHPVRNFWPKVLGPMTLRPGSESLAAVPGNVPMKMVRFYKSPGTSYLLLFSAAEMRILRNGAIVQVPSVATVINTGSWTDVSTSPATATGGATLSFSATDTAPARLRQGLTVAGGDQSRVNILRIVVSAGPLVLRIGTTAGGQELVADTSLDTGTHKIGVTPGAATIYVELRSDSPVTRSVSQVQFEATLLGGAGDLVVPTPWATFAQVQKVRRWQSIDVLFCGDGLSQQKRIEHRGPSSWSVVDYKSRAGPWINGSNLITLTPAGLTGNTTITASEAMFDTGHVGALLETTQTSKTVVKTLGALNDTTDYVTVVGVGAGRNYYVTTTGTLTGTLTMERSLDPGTPTSWSANNVFVNGAATFSRTQFNDSLTNTAAHYRLRITAYTSGSLNVTLEYESDVQTSLSRITQRVSATVVNVETLVNFGNTNPTRNWRISDWSGVRGWPRQPVIHDGRLHWFRGDQHYGSVSDDFASFDDRVAGDSAPLQRSVGTGGSDGVLWAHSTGRLMAGTTAYEAVIQASELDEPLTPTRYTVRIPSRRGCADIEPAEYDDGIFFAQRSGRRVYELAPGENSASLRSMEISRLNPAAYRAGVVRMAVQQQPETRLYTVLTDGTVTALTHERSDKVAAITTVQIAGGLVEDIETLPDVDQDDVYLIVNRSGVRYIERLAKEANQTSPDTCGLLDGHKVLTGSVTAISGATHMVGQVVQVYADGIKRDDVTISGGGTAALTGGPFGRVVYGKEYLADWLSVKLAYAAKLGTAVGQTKIVRAAGLILSNACLDGIAIGKDSTWASSLPPFADGAATTFGQFFTAYDHDLMPLYSDWNPDSRVYLRTLSSNGPVTVQALVLDIETRDGAHPQAG